MSELIAVEDEKGGFPKAIIALIVAALALTVLAAYWVTNDTMVSLLLAAGMAFFAGLVWLYVSLMSGSEETQEYITDWAIAAAVADQSGQIVAITDRAGRLVCASTFYARTFGHYIPPADLIMDGGSAAIAMEVGRAAWRDGEAMAEALYHGGKSYALDVRRVGRAEDHLLWHFEAIEQTSLIEDAQRLVSGIAGRLASDQGIMLAAVDAQGHILSANTAYAVRATGDGMADLKSRDFAEFMRLDETQNIFFAREGQAASPVRLLQFPLAEGEGTAAENDADQASLLMLLDRHDAVAHGGSTLAQVEMMFALLPFGLAMVSRDGRFLFANNSFANASGIGDGGPPPYPGDLVVAEDKGVMADMVRRFAIGSAQNGDLTVRFKHQPEEPVSLGIAGVRGLGDAAVLLSLRDSREEAALKQQVAQASKMQAVGQLAGGVAHDFNNVLTAILGHCDLMLLRHSPGDGDYDDVQQIKNNAARAASLTRQLLAFSRQQTLRPQTIQLPDIIAETSHLLQRLIGEKVKLEVRHDRNLGAIRADPGQLEQVIINLAVNARDAMASGGTLTIETRRILASDVRAMNSEIMPVADYSAIVVRDTGCGISAENQAKIFEPFFTTKQVGKGTGLGLSTVYGIVKQSGGYIFVDSAIGRGTTFTLYFPVYDGRDDPALEPETKSLHDAPDNQWASGTILLVEDEDMVRAVAERALVRQGYTVITASDGEDGVEHFAAHKDRIDLVITDVVMPGMDGPAMARRIRAQAPDMPLVFMSGYAEEQLRQSIDVANMGFLPKPFTVAQICDSAGRMLRRQKESA